MFLRKFGYNKSNTRYIDSNVKIEKDCFIGRGCSIYGDVKLMNYSHIENNTIIFGPAIIGKKTYIGPNCLLGYPDRERIKKTITNLKKFDYSSISDKLEIGNECIISSGTIIYDNVKIGNEVEFGHNVMIREKVEAGGCRVKISGISNGRTLPQNRALHKWLAMMADQMNDAGYSHRKLWESMKESFDIPVTPSNLKEIAQSVAYDLFEERHTSKLTTTQLSRLYEVLKYLI